MSLEATVVNLQRQVSDLATNTAWKSLKSNFWQWLAVAISLFFCVLFAGLYLHSAGVLNLAAIGMASGVIPSAGKGAGDFRDLLTILVPMFAAGVAFVVSAAGMRRLQSYDDELARSRQERRDDEKSLRREAADNAALLRKETADSASAARTEISTISDKLQTQFKGEREAFAAQIQKEAKEAFESQFEKVKDDVDRLKSETKATLEETVTKVLGNATSLEARLNKDFGFIKGRDFLSELGTESTVSVGALYTEVTKLFGKGEAPSHRRAVEQVEAALAKPERMFGTPTDWFNLSAQLGRSKNELLALRVCTTALDRFNDSSNPKFEPNHDLLAHAIQFSSVLGRWDECSMLIERAEGIGRERWTERLFLFMGEHYQNRGDEVDFLKLTHDFERCLPYSEQPYSQLASYWQKAGQLEKALDAIESGLKKPGVRGERLLTRKSDLLLELGRYQQVIEATTAALAANATSQPGGAQWAILFNRACAFDALLWQHIDGAGLNGASAEMSELEVGQASSLARSAVAFYRAALKTPGINLSVETQAEMRIQLIGDMCALKGLTLEASGSDITSETASKQQDITEGPAKQLTAQLVEAFKREIPEGAWSQLRDGLAGKLQRNFNAGARAIISQEIRLAAGTEPAASEKLIEFADRLSPE